MAAAVVDESQTCSRSRLAHFKRLPPVSPVLDPISIANDHQRSHDPPPRPGRVKTGGVLQRTENISRLPKDDEAKSSSDSGETQHPDIEMMRERFAKLLLGEDMSGGGKGVSSALALSNAITNLAASVFGEQKRLEPMLEETKTRWRKEMETLLSVTDHIVELVPSKHRSTDGTIMEIMVTKQRSDLQMNIPALRKLDEMLLDCLENFKDQKEFYYKSKNGSKSEEESIHRQEKKWWIPSPKVPPKGLPKATRKWLQHQKDTINQVLKAAMAINNQVLAEMEIPESYILTLPKNGRDTLGDSMYKSITNEDFDPGYFLSSVDLSSEYKIVDIKSRVEASVVIWNRKLNSKDSKSSSVHLEKREIIEERAQTILLMLKFWYPGLPQSDLDISKIQCNRDVGQAILESYSRSIESFAFAVLSRIDDVMHADDIAKNPARGIRHRWRSDGNLEAKAMDLDEVITLFGMELRQWIKDVNKGRISRRKLREQSVLETIIGRKRF